MDSITNDRIRLGNPPKPSRKEKQERYHKAKFLAMPGEIRNKIYRLCLPDTSVTITSSGYARPAVINVNKQVRREALKIFYYETTLRHYTHSFNSDLIHKFQQQVHSLGLSRKKVVIELRGTFDTGSTRKWANVMVWLKRYYERKIKATLVSPNSLQQKGKHGVERYVVGGMFGLVKDLRDKLEWDVLAGVLLAQQRPILVEIDERWGRD